MDSSENFFSLHCINVDQNTNYVPSVSLLALLTNMRSFVTVCPPQRRLVHHSSSFQVSSLMLHLIFTDHRWNGGFARQWKIIFFQRLRDEQWVEPNNETTAAACLRVCRFVCPSNPNDIQWCGDARHHGDAALVIVRFVMETKAWVECMIMLKAVRVSLDTSMYTHTVYKYTALYRGSLVFRLKCHAIPYSPIILCISKYNSLKLHFVYSNFLGEYLCHPKSFCCCCLLLYCYCCYSSPLHYPRASALK